MKISASDSKRIRNWTLYVIRLDGNNYYIGITSYKDFMRRIRQHGTTKGARVNRYRTVEEIIEVHHLGRISALEAVSIENDMTIQYMKKYGIRNVRGGHNIQKKLHGFPAYNPGSTESLLQIVFALLIALVLFLIILFVGYDHF